MKNKYKIFLILLLSLFVVNLKKVDAVNVNINIDSSPGGGATSASGGCEDCAWTYISNNLGVRLSLYTYDGKNLVFKTSTDLVNEPPTMKKVNTTKEKYGRYNYTKLGATIDFGYYDNKVKDINDFKFNDIKETTVWSKQFAEDIQKYFGNTTETTIQGIKNMFDIDVGEAELSKYYIVAEPTAYFYNRADKFYTYATGFEYMSILLELDVHTGAYKHNLWASQGSTFLGYLFNGMYNATDFSKKYQGFNDGRYDYYNFIAQDSDTSIVKTTSNVLSTKSQIKNNNAYEAVNYPYGVMVFWIGQNGNIGCKGICNNLSGDALLKCAENFCSNQNGITDSFSKGNCIINACGYSYDRLTCGNTTNSNANNTYCASTTTSSKDSCQIVNKEDYSYKVECTTSTTTNYPTSLPTTLTPGSGFEYQLKLYGNKTCTITFDKELWKYNYAASYSDSERSKYIQAIANFNKLSFDSYFYESKNGNISIEINEKINGKNTASNKTLKAEENYYKGNQDVTSTSKNSLVSSYHNKVEKSLSVKTYTTDSSNGTIYNLPGVCISAKDNISVKEGSVCDNGLGPYDKYFTNIYADLTTNKTETKVLHNISGMDTTNQCNYEINNDKLSCYITAETASGQTGDVLINNEDIIFTLHAVSNDKNKKISYNLGSTIKLKGDNFNNSTSKTIYKNTFNGDQIVYGTVTDGTNYAYCKKELSITENVCKFEIIENSNNTKTIKIKNEKDPSAEYYIKDSTSNKWMNIQSKTIKNDVNITIWGKVKTNNNTTYCIINFPKENNKTCTDLFKPVEYFKIRNYCNAYWKNDTAAYTSANDCYISCTNSKKQQTCKQINTCTDITSIKKYCKSQYQRDGYKSIASCVNDCSCGNIGLNYYYRIISLTNPFPDREPGYNWLGYEEFITNDLYDSTPSTKSEAPEYEIVLDSKRINSIKKHTKKYVSSGQDAYGDYIRANKNDTGSYKSKFIHVDEIEEGGFSTYFTYIEGVKTGG